MISSKFFLASSAIAVLASCGGSEPPAVTRVAVAAASASSNSPPVATPIDLARYWPFDQSVDMAAYADVHGLLATTLGSALVPSALALLKAGRTSEQVACIQQAVAAAREIAVGAADERRLLLVRYDDESYHPDACLAAFGAKGGAVEGALDAYAFGDEIVALAPGVLIVGTEPTVEAALQVPTAKRSFQPQLALAKDEYMSFSFREGDVGTANGSLFASDARFGLRVHAGLPEFSAKSVEGIVQAFLGAPRLPDLSDDENAFVARIAGMVTFTREGGAMDLTFNLVEPPLDQAHDLGILAGVAVHGVRAYMRDAKLAEKTSTIDSIAKDYAEWWRHDDGTPRARRKLVALPPVPSDVPRNAKYQSGTDDWKAWREIGFAMSDPQYFQYGVEIAKGGKSGSIVARGDLNGDGVDSIYRLEFHVTPGKPAELTFAPGVTATNPEK